MNDYQKYIRVVKYTGFYELLERIRERPYLFLKSYMLSNLYNFLAGYTQAKTDYKIPITSEEDEFSNFQEWICSRYRVKKKFSWAKIIVFHSMDERDGLDRFFELLDEFKSERST